MIKYGVDESQIKEGSVKKDSEIHNNKLTAKEKEELKRLRERLLRKPKEPRTN